MGVISNTPRPGYVWDSTDNVWYPIGVGAHQHTNAADTPAVMPYSTYAAAGKNKIINGDFSIWQRGTSFSSIASGSYGADRWTVGAVGDTVNFTRQAFTVGDIQSIGYGNAQYFARLEVVSSNGSVRLVQKVENVDTLANQSVTVSFWAKASTATSLDIYLQQYFGTGGSATVTSTTEVVSLTTSWQRFTKTITLPSIAGKTIGAGNYLGLELRETTASPGVSFDFWGVQLEAGSTVTAFQTATGNPASELAACERYFQAFTPATVYSYYGIGCYNSTTLCYISIKTKTTMRTAPTAAFSAANTFLSNQSGAKSVSAVAADQLSPDFAGIVFTTATATSGGAAIVQSNNTLTSSIQLSAEL